MQYLHCPHICHRELFHFKAGKIGLCQSWQSASLWSGGLQIGQAEVLMACLWLSRLTFKSESLAFVSLESRLWHFIYHFKPLIGKREREEFIYLFRQMNIAYWRASWMKSFVSAWLGKMLALLRPYVRFLEKCVSGMTSNKILCDSTIFFSNILTFWLL